MLWKEGLKYYPGTITYTNSDGTFAVKWEWANYVGKNEETRHKSHVFATKLRVRERLGPGFAVWVGVWVCAVGVCVCGCSRWWSVIRLRRVGE